MMKFDNLPEGLATQIDPAQWLVLNAKLQAKKSSLRKALAAKGTLQKGGYNAFDRYTYFSEAQYKALFEELMPAHGLELTSSELAHEDFDGTDKQAFGRRVTVAFCLSDTETGFGEVSMISGEGMDKGDKGIYKAYTGALKYYLANTFMVATGDDPEQDSPQQKPAQKPAKQEPPKQTPQASPKHLQAVGEARKKALAAGVSDQQMFDALQHAIGPKASRDYTEAEAARAVAIIDQMAIMQGAANGKN